MRLCRLRAALGLVVALTAVPALPADALGDPRDRTDTAGGGAVAGVTAPTGSEESAPARITTVAGGLPQSQPATQVSISPAGVAFDGAGNLFVADSAAGLIWRVTPAGAASVVAGTGRPCSLGFSYYDQPPECGLDATGSRGPRAALEVPLLDPTALAFGPDGALYFSEMRGHTIRRLDLESGVLSLVAGTRARVYSPDEEGAPATQANLDRPQGIAFDSAGNLYVADHGNQRIRRIDPGGHIRTVAGCGEQRYPQCFDAPRDGSPVEGTALTYPQALAVGPDDRLYLEVRGGIFALDEQDGVFRRVAGEPFDYADFPGQGEGGPAGNARFDHVTAMTFAADGSLYLVDSWWNRVQRIAAPAGADSILSHVAGCGCGQGDSYWRANGYAGDGGPASRAALALARSTRGEGHVAVARDGTVVIADILNSRVRAVDPATQTIRTIAGNGEPSSAGRLYVPMELQPAFTQGGHSGDGRAATTAQLHAPADVATDAAGNVYVLERYAGRVRRIATDGTITTVAGTACPIWTCDVDAVVADGTSATAARFHGASHIALDPTGTQLYVTDTYHFRVWQVNLGAAPVTAYPVSTRPVTIAPGAIATVFGSGGQCYALSPGCYAEGGHALDTTASLLQGVAVDSAGNLYVSDAGAHAVHRVDRTTGLVTRVAGQYSGDLAVSSCPTTATDGPGRATALCGPTDLAVGPGDVLYVVESGIGFTISRGRVRRVELSDPLLRTSVLAGNGNLGYGGDGGPAADATLAAPHGVTAAPDGTVYIADTGNSRIRRVGPDGKITTVAGQGEYLFAPGWPTTGEVAGCDLAGDGGPAAEALLCAPTGVAVGPDGGLYVADQVNNRVRVVTGL